MDQVTLKQRIRNSHSHNISLPLAKSITFRHPGYKLDNVLFTLPRLDASPQSGEAAGVHHGTALLACQIIANNAFDGFLTTDQEGAHRVLTTTALDGVLLDDDYWFQVEGGDDAAIYPVVPRFEEWQFPHSFMDSLPWDPKSRAVAPETHANVPDRPAPTPPAIPSSNPFAPPPSRRCILSNNAYATQRAHLVPTAQSRWFQVNSMRRYGDNLLFINAEQNKVSVRHDLHKLWDDFVFTLVPKRGGRDFVVHVLGIPSPAASEFAHEWHNTPVQEGALDGVEKAFLFAKFAQAVFLLFKPFVAFAAERRYIATFQTSADDNPLETTTAWASVSDLTKKYSGGGSRSASASAGSRKRSQSQISGPEEEEDEGDSDARNVRPRLWSSVLEEDEEEDDWFEKNLEGRHLSTLEKEDDWFETYLTGPSFDESVDEERGRYRHRQRHRRRERSEHTVDTLPSLTDTSAAGDLEDNLMGSSGVLASSPSNKPVATHGSKGLAVEDNVLSVENAT